MQININLILNNRVDFFTWLGAHGYQTIASCLSVRCMKRIGSGYSLQGCLRTGSLLNFSVVDFGTIGSTLSTRCFGRLNQSFSLLKFSHLGSSLSTRSCVKVGLKTLSTLGTKIVTINPVMKSPVINIRHIFISEIASFKAWGCSKYYATFHDRGFHDRVERDYLR